MRAGARKNTAKTRMNGRCDAARTSAFCMARLADVKKRSYKVGFKMKENKKCRVLSIILELRIIIIMMMIIIKNK